MISFLRTLFRPDQTDICSGQVWESDCGRYHWRVLDIDKDDIEINLTMEGGFRSGFNMNRSDFRRTLRRYNARLV